MVYSSSSNSLPTRIPTDMLTDDTDDDSDMRDKDKATEHVASLLGDDLDRCDLFCQMDVLREYRDDLVWKEMARWVRYEEAVEEGGKRWSKPHVSSMAMEALQDLQHLLSTCPILLDLEAIQMSDIVDNVLNAWIRQMMLPSILKNHFRSVLLKQHKHQHNRTKMGKKTISNLHKLHKSSPNLTIYKKEHEGYVNGAYDSPSESECTTISAFAETCPDSPSLAFYPKMNSRFIKKIPPGAEVANLLVGEVEELNRRVAAFVRLEKAKNVGDITEVKLNTRFIFILLGPKGQLGACAEITRCMASLFTDEIFRCVAYKAQSRKDILAGLQEFSRYLTVLPPGSWDPATRIEPPETLPSQEFRKNVPASLSTNKNMAPLHSGSEQTEDSHTSDVASHDDPALMRTGRLFGGLIQDVKRKLPWYPSDFKDALHVQTIASFFFLFLATLTPNVTFGGLLGVATEQYMGTMECILAAAISGIIFSLFAGQPLNILGSTGPMLVLELILFRFCKDHDWDFMPFRVWVGFWTAFFLLIVVAFDLSALVRYITRFTEDSFACLIALIFIYQAFLKTFEIANIAPVHTFPEPGTDSVCFCAFPNTSTSVADSYQNETHTTTLPLIMSLHIKFPLNLTLKFPVDLIEAAKNRSVSVSDILDQCTSNGGVLLGNGCEMTSYVPDVFFFSLILFVGTFALSVALVKFRNSLFFPTWVRQNVSDFAVLISIVVMVLIDALLGIPTPKLTVPAEIKPTRPGRSWLISPLSDKNPWWLIILSVLPAILATILIFMDQQITAVIVNRKENKLQKGAGYHLDMLVLSVLIVVLSILGLPWYVAATVSALAHVMSLKKESECTAPGEKPVNLGVREQRVTSLLVGVFSGLAVFITSVLQYIPMPVLYGVFLYMGVAPLGRMQLVQRSLLVFMPAKYQPDYDFLRHVPIRRVHLFTAIQVFCLVVLWVVKSVKSISIAFPVMVVIICFVRKGLDKVFTQRELRWLDEILPSMARARKGSEDSNNSDTKTWPNDVEKGFGLFNKIKKMPRRSLSDPADGDRENKPKNMALGPRYSLPFLCKTDLDLIKEMNGEHFQDRRKSLLILNEKKRARHSMYDVFDGEKVGKKISTNSLKEGKQYRRKLAQHKADDFQKASRMTSLPVPTGVSDSCHTVSNNRKASDCKKLKGIRTNHVL